jgi:hypothetical protein
MARIAETPHSNAFLVFLSIFTVSHSHRGGIATTLAALDAQFLNLAL